MPSPFLLCSRLSTCSARCPFFPSFSDRRERMGSPSQRMNAQNDPKDDKDVSKSTPFFDIYGPDVLSLSVLLFVFFAAAWIFMGFLFGLGSCIFDLWVRFLLFLIAALLFLYYARKFLISFVFCGQLEISHSMVFSFILFGEDSIFCSETCLVLPLQEWGMWFSTSWVGIHFL